MTILKIILGIVALYLFLCTAPTPGIDCRNYHQDSFYGITVNCGGGK